MAHGNRRKCKCCLKIFRPDPRNRRHQSYCSAPTCKAASKAASQARWLAKPENQDYFRGPVNTARVKAWRAAIPATGAIGGTPALRYKRSRPSNPLIPRPNPAISRTRRYKMSYRRNLLF